MGASRTGQLSGQVGQTQSLARSPGRSAIALMAGLAAVGAPARHEEFRRKLDESPLRPRWLSDAGPMHGKSRDGEPPDETTMQGGASPMDGR